MSLLRLLVASVALCVWISAGVQATQPTNYAVERVIDGDTVVLEQVGTVRLIGIDTPETVDPRVPVQAFGYEAAAHLRALLEGHTLRLEYDQQRMDRYDRTLAYLYRSDGLFVNLAMVRSGYAHAYVKYPFRLMDTFRAAEREARAAGRGLWATTSEATAIQPAISAPAEAVQVWVNTSSRVYHCPGTRYYGKTARGEYMTESEANQKGHRAAYGRRCGPEMAPATNKAASMPRSLATTPSSPTNDVRVWVNTASGVYHCQGARYYGNTRRGEYLTEAEALRRGHRAAGGKGCGGASKPAPSASPPATSQSLATPSAAAASVSVWVNTSSGVYHCSGTRYYGATKNGAYMTEGDARAAGHRPAGGRTCGQ